MRKHSTDAGACTCQPVAAVERPRGFASGLQQGVRPCTAWSASRHVKSQFPESGLASESPSVAKFATLSCAAQPHKTKLFAEGKWKVSLARPKLGRASATLRTASSCPGTTQLCKLKVLEFTALAVLKFHNTNVLDSNELKREKWWHLYDIGTRPSTRLAAHFCAKIIIFMYYWIYTPQRAFFPKGQT